MNKAEKIRLIRGLLTGEIDKHVTGQVFIDDGKGQFKSSLSGKAISKSKIDLSSYKTVFFLPDNGRN
jgi:hypothetical protein